MNGYKYENVCPCPSPITHVHILILPLVNFGMGRVSFTRKGGDKEKMRIRGRISGA